MKFKSSKYFPTILLSFIIVSAVFSLSLSNISQKKVTLKQKAAEEQSTSPPVSEWVPIDLASFNQGIDKETAELTRELNQLPSQRLSVKDKTKRQDVLNRSLWIKQITKEEHNLMDENKDGKISYEEFNKRDVILANKVYQLRHTTLSTLDDGLYDERMIRITTDNLNQYSSLINDVLRVIVEAGIYQDILSSLQTYRLDVIRDWSYNVQFFLCNNCQKETNTPGPVGIKNLLRSQGTVGTVFIGDLPAVWYKVPCAERTDVFPTDIYYMDLNGLWSQEINCIKRDVWDEEIIYSGTCFTSHTGDLYPEIFFGRLTAPEEAGEIRLITNYFDKNHAYRIGNIFLSHRSLNYFDDDWVNSSVHISEEIASSYPDYDLINDPLTTSVNDYKNRGNIGYEHHYLAAHAYYGGFYFGSSVPNWLFSEEIRDLKPKFYFINLFSCSAALFTVENYLAGWYGFQEGNFGLAVIGSTKTGGMFSSYSFYRSLAANNSFGSALKDWFIQDYYGTDQCWSYGLTLIGDPTLKILPPNVPTVTPIPTPSLRMPICRNYRANFTYTGYKINIAYDFVGNNDPSAKLKVRGWYRKLPNGSWKMISEDSLTGNQRGTYLGEIPVSRFDSGERFFTSAGIVAYYDFDNDNSIDTNEPRVACKASECLNCSKEVPIPRR